MANIARLRELEAAATKAPWFHSQSANVPRNQQGDINWPAHLGRDLSIHWDYYVTREDAELIVELRNSFPALVEIADAARALINAWDDETRTRARAGLNAALQRLEES